MLSLDVGCGEIGLCDVNCDIKKPDIIPQNFVLCDAQFLPFNDECFVTVFSNHVIEHIKNPYRFLREVLRVCKNNGIVLLRLPHRFSRGAKYKGHINFFDYKWFADNLVYPFYYIVSRWSPLKIFLWFPDEIRLKIFKVV